MKSKYSLDLVPYIFLSVVGVVLVGIIVYYVVNTVHNTTNLADQVISSTEETASEYADYEIAKYDGEVIRGAEVVNLIKKQLGDYDGSETAPIFVEVVTKLSGTTYSNKYVNKEFLDDIKNFSRVSNYIKPTALFGSEVVKTSNNVILGVMFHQK